MRSMKKLWILTMALGLLVTGCSDGEKEAADAPALLEPVSVAENTIQVERQDLYSASYIDASVVPAMEELYFVMDGEVLSVDVVEGQMVEEGQVLAVLDQTALEESIKALQENISYTDSSYSRRLTQANLSVQIAEAKLAKLQAEYDEQEQKKAEEEAKKKAEAEAAARAAAQSVSVMAKANVLLTSADLQDTNSSMMSSLETGDLTSSGGAGDSGDSENTSVPQDSSAPQDSNTSVPQESSSAPQDSNTSVPQESSSAPQDSNTSVPQESSSAPQDSSTSEPRESSSVPQDSNTSVPQESSSAPQDSNASQESSQPQESDKTDEKDPEKQEPGITQYDLQQARLAVQEAELAYSQLSDEYYQEMAQMESEMQSLLNKVGEDTLTAPFSGRIVKINCTVGSYIRGYDVVVQIVDESVKMLRGEKYYNDALKLAANLDVIINNEVYEVTYIPYDDDEYLRRMMNNEPLPTWFNFDCPDDVTFGESGTIRIYNDFSEDALVVPGSCIQTDDLGSYVYKAEDGQRVKTYVTIGVTTASFSEIVEGLEEGDEVYGAE